MTTVNIAQQEVLKHKALRAFNALNAIPASNALPHSELRGLALATYELNQGLNLHALKTPGGSSAQHFGNALTNLELLRGSSLERSALESPSTPDDLLIAMEEILERCLKLRSAA